MMKQYRNQVIWTVHAYGNPLKNPQAGSTLTDTCVKFGGIG